MYGFSIDDRPGAPVGTKATRRAVAIHWHWTTEYTNVEIAKALGVTEVTIEKYLEEPPNQEVKQMMDGVESEVRLVAVSELKEQLRAAGHESKTAECPVKVYQDDDGNLVVKDKTDDMGEVVDRYALPADLEMGPDRKARFFRRQEVREILELLCEIVGANEPTEVKVESDSAATLADALKNMSGDK